MGLCAYYKLILALFKIYYLCSEMPEVLKNERSLRFRKFERLRLRSLVETLYTKGKKIYGSPLRVVWHIVSADELTSVLSSETIGGVGRVQVMTVVPKRWHRRAVRRVLLRRRMKEAYRLNRHHLSELSSYLENENLYLSLAFLYSSAEVAEYAVIEECIVKMLEKISVKELAKLEGKTNDD